MHDGRYIVCALILKASQRHARALACDDEYETNVGVRVFPSRYFASSRTHVGWLWARNCRCIRTIATIVLLRPGWASGAWPGGGWHQFGG